MLLRRSDIEPPTLIVIISRDWDEDPATLYDTTRFAWPFSWRERHKAERAEVILASYEREIVGAFTADEWLPATAKGNLQGFYSIRVNEQWRIIFRWSENSAHQVSLTDYH